MGKDKTFATKEDDAFEYICSLEVQYETSKNSYLTSKAKAEKAQKELSRTETWKSLLEGYLAAAEKTDRLAEDVINSFSKSKQRSEAICNNASNAYQAFQWMVDDMIKITSCVEEYKCAIDECTIQLSNAPQSDPLIVGLKRLQKAVDDAFKCLLDALKEWLNVLKSSQILFRQLSDKSGDSAGLDYIIGALSANFTGTKGHILYTSSNCLSCSEPARPGFPLAPEPCGAATTNTYGCITKEELTTAENCITTYLAEYSTASKEMAESKACMDSLETALKVAKETNACKTK